MSKRAKYAFADESDVEAFIKENVGTMAFFNKAIRTAYENMRKNTKMIRETRKGRGKASAGHQHQDRLSIRTTNKTNADAEG
ncbi:MAG TPA: hypothetical protein VL087_07285 [Nitrospirota bacterium]|nr:hypothetical protein [Nitrospirota bacterium]